MRVVVFGASGATGRQARARGDRLAGVALLVPRIPLVKEWAYAGLIINYPGAAASHAVMRDGPSALIGPIVFTGLVIISWALRPASRRLPIVS
jgi:DoxX-like family